MLRFIYLVNVSPSVHSRLMDEINAAQAEGRLSNVVTFREAQALPYFQAALRESIRYGPASGLSLPRRVPPQGATVDGEYLAPGTEVCLNAWVLHRDQAVFGPDADYFRPERWLECTEEQNKTMERSMFHVRISYGPGREVVIFADELPVRCWFAHVLWQASSHIGNEQNAPRAISEIHIYSARA